ncbi:hypothetical protein BJV74DRAFT_34170 [Russula compacta]|nr:hypothetical protein BJV74DRAFT_34170 [Russula compacta]
MSSPSPSPLPSPSRGNPPNGGISHTTVALICVFIVCFSFFIYLSSKAPRVSEPVQAAESRARQFNPRRSKPKLWEVCLDDDPLHELELEHLGPDVRNWRPITAWSDNSLTPPHLQQNSLRPEAVMDHHVAIAQAWLRGTYAFPHKRPDSVEFSAPPPQALPSVSDSRMLNVAIFVAMPSRQKDAQHVQGSTPHPAVSSRLSYKEGQLVLGVTSLPHERQCGAER